MNDFLDLKISSRFLLVNVLPTALLFLLVGGIAASGPPSQAPSWSRLTDRVESLGWVGAAILTVAVVALSFILHPLSYPMVQILEGYWEALPFGRVARIRSAAKYKRWHQELIQHYGRMADDLMWMPRNRNAVGPTRLGNVLYAGEVRAGDRYGYRTEVILQQILPLASKDVHAEVVETRNQLDTAARLCSAGMIAVPATGALLWPYPPWLLLPLGCYVFAWAAYRSSVAAAMRFSEALAVLVDLYRLQLWDALSLPRPKNLAEEHDQAVILSDLLEGRKAIPSEVQKQLNYVPGAAAPEPAGAVNSPATVPTPIVGRKRRWLIKRLGGSI